MNIKERIINDISLRIDNQIKKGVEKYGHSLDDCPYDAYDWLVMQNEELVDGLQYANKEIKRLKSVVLKLSTELRATKEVTSHGNQI